MRRRGLHLAQWTIRIRTLSPPNLLKSGEQIRIFILNSFLRATLCILSRFGTSVADPDPGSGIRCFFTLWTRDPDPG
jgi:hypothetical protein